MDQCKLCNDYMKTYEEKQETDRIHQFLLGLNDTFITLRTQILSLDNLLIMSKVLGLVIQEEKQRIKFRDSANEKTHDLILKLNSSDNMFCSLY